jgi:hypothetical protein
MSKKNLRPRPPVGTIIGIRLPKGGFGHAILTGYSKFWIYNFITSNLCRDSALFPSSRWLQRYSLRDAGVGSDTADELQLVLTDEELRCGWVWQRRDPDDVAAENESPPRPYEVEDTNEEDDMKKRFFNATEEEIKKHPGRESTMFTPKQVVDYIESRRTELEFITLREDQIFIPPVNQEPSPTFNPGCRYEIWLSGLEEMELDDLEAIAEEIDEELEEHSAGEVMGTGGVVGQDQHNIAVRAAPDKDKQALACIRRALKRLKANPETTDIWRNDESGKNLGLK